MSGEPLATPEPTSTDRATFWAAVALALALRISLLARFHHSPFFGLQEGDMQFYYDWANRIAHGNWTDRHAFYGLPGYAFLLAGFQWLFGAGSFVTAVLLIQALLGAGVAGLIFALTRGALSSSSPRLAVTTALLASVAWDFFIPGEALGLVLMPTIGLVFAYWLCVGSAAGKGRTGVLWPWGPLGLLVGIGATMVATILFAIPLLVISAWKRSARGWLAVTMIAGGVGVGTSPAWIHNFFVAREPVFLSAHSGINFWIGNYPEADGYPKIPTGLRTGQQELLDDSIRVAEKEVGHPLTRTEVSRYWSAKAWAEIRSHPARWIRLLGWKLRAFWNAFEYDDLTIDALFREDGIIGPGLSFGIVAAFGLAGLLWSLAAPGSARWVAAGVLLHMMALSPVFITERYRIAAVPGLLVLGGVAMARLFEALSLRAWSRGAILAGLVVVGSAAVFLPPSGQALVSMQPYNMAVSELDAVSHLPMSAQAGRALLLDHARAHLALAQSHAPRNPSLLFAFGRYWTERGDRVQAKAYYRQAIESDASYADAYTNLAIMAFEEKRWDFAAKLFAASASLNPRDAGARYLLARSRFELKDIAGARTAIQQALRIEPANPVFHQFEQQLPP